MKHENISTTEDTHTPGAIYSKDEVIAFLEHNKVYRPAYDEDTHGYNHRYPGDIAVANAIKPYMDYASEQRRMANAFEERGRKKSFEVSSRKAQQAEEVAGKVAVHAEWLYKESQHHNSYRAPNYWDRIVEDKDKAEVMAYAAKPYMDYSTDKKTKAKELLSRDKLAGASYSSKKAQAAEYLALHVADHAGDIYEHTEKYLPSSEYVGSKLVLDKDKAEDEAYEISPHMNAAVDSRSNAIKYLENGMVRGRQVAIEAAKKAIDKERDARMVSDSRARVLEILSRAPPPRKIL